MEQRPSKQGHYTVPELSIKDAKDWFVYFRFTQDGKEYLRKYRQGINRIKDKGQRMTQAEQLRQEREDWLKMGWNPILDPDFKLRNIIVKQGKTVMYLNDALDYAMSKKTLKKKSKLGYGSMLSFIKEIALKTGASMLEVAQMDRGACLDLIDECAKERDFSNHAYNKYISILRSMFSVLLDRRLINANPLSDFKDKTVPESNKYAPYTEDEKRRIAKHLARVHPQLFVVMSVVYHTGIRPQEALELLIRDVDMKEDIITIAQEADNLEKSKTTSVRKVPINPHLYQLLDGMHVDRFPADYFVFGTPFQRGGRMRAMHPTYFTPNQFHVKRDTLTKLWKKLVIDGPPDGLGIKKHLYAAKHTGTDDKVEAGLELKEVQHLYGHQSEAMTERYNKKKRAMEAKKEILEKSPAFSKV